MPRFNVTMLRYMEREEMRVLQVQPVFKNNRVVQRSRLPTGY